MYGTCVCECACEFAGVTKREREREVESTGLKGTLWSASKTVKLLAP
jgi:hypothetical protein